MTKKRRDRLREAIYGKPPPEPVTPWKSFEPSAKCDLKNSFFQFSAPEPEEQPTDITWEELARMPADRERQAIRDTNPFLARMRDERQAIRAQDLPRGHPLRFALLYGGQAAPMGRITPQYQVQSTISDRLSQLGYEEQGPWIELDSIPHPEPRPARMNLQQFGRALRSVGASAAEYAATVRDYTATMQQVARAMERRQSANVIFGFDPGIHETSQETESDIKTISDISNLDPEYLNELGRAVCFYVMHTDDPTRRLTTSIDRSPCYPAVTVNIRLSIPTDSLRPMIGGGSGNLHDLSNFVYAISEDNRNDASLLDKVTSVIGNDEILRERLKETRPELYKILNKRATGRQVPAKPEMRGAVEGFLATYNSEKRKAGGRNLTVRKPPKSENTDP